MNNKALNIMIPEDMYNKLREEANKQDRSLASLVRVIVNKYFENKK